MLRKIRRCGTLAAPMMLVTLLCMGCWGGQAIQAPLPTATQVATPTEQAASTTQVTPLALAVETPRPTSPPAVTPTAVRAQDAARGTTRPIVASKDICAPGGVLREAEAIYECSAVAMAALDFVKMELRFYSENVTTDGTGFLVGMNSIEIQAMFAFPDRKDLTVLATSGEKLRVIVIDDETFVQNTYGSEWQYASEWQQADVDLDIWERWFFGIALPEGQREYVDGDGASWLGADFLDGGQGYVLEALPAWDAYGAALGADKSIVVIRIDSDSFRQTETSLYLENGEGERRPVLQVFLYGFDEPVEILEPPATALDSGGR